MAMANGQCDNCTFYTAHLDFTTAQIVIHCTLKYALRPMTFTPDSIAPPDIPLLDCSPHTTVRGKSVYGGNYNLELQCNRNCYYLHLHPFGYVYLCVGNSIDSVDKGVITGSD